MKEKRDGSKLAKKAIFLQHCALFLIAAEPEVRYLYTLLFYLALPIVLIRLFKRSIRQPEYRARLNERFGFTNLRLNKSLWVHTVSVGEVLAAIPLIKSLQKKYPDLPIVVTTMTPTGAARLKNALGESIFHLYVPYDLPAGMFRFLQSIKPVAAIVMETELWPNLLACCRVRGIPVCLINARLSEKSALSYGRIRGLTRAMLQNLTVIAAHGHKDAQRFLALGADPKKVVVTGNIKFDLALPADLVSRGKCLRQKLGDSRFIWIAASTHEGEEEIILAAHKKLCAFNDRALLILVPRHPDRFHSIYKLCNELFVTKRRSKDEVCTSDTAVYLGDTMGELLLMYSACEVAFVAGSLIPRGGHNILEPGALGKAIITGPHLFNFAEISELFITAKSLKKVADADSLSEELIKLLQQPEQRQAMGERALQVVMQNRGALAKQLNLVTSLVG